LFLPAGRRLRRHAAALLALQVFRHGQGFCH
jgi:hypothetical protein